MHFVFDLDGTLCFDRMTIDQALLDQLAKATDYGHEVTFASARSYRDCLPLLKELGQSRVVGLNGGLVYESGQLVFDKPLDKLAYQEALSACHQYDLPYFVDDDFHYSSHRSHKMPFIASVDQLNLAQHKAIQDLEHPIKMVIYVGDHLDILSDLRQDLEAFASLDISYDQVEHCLYLNPYRTSKATTLLDWIGRDYIAFGNDQNDIAMFEQARYAVQVGDFPALSPHADTQIALDDRLIPNLLKQITTLFENYQGR